MAVRVLWSREEAIILLDALIQTRDGKIDRSSAILDVSKKLRKLAQDKGLDIDDVYRNVNGITLQMKAMEYYFTDGKQGLNKPAKLFQEVVELYKNDRNEYEKLLREVKGVTTENNVADQFAQWLSERVSPRQLSELYMAYADVEAFCLARKILKKKLFETTDRKTIKAVVDTVNSNRVFRFNYRKNLGRTNSAMKYYYDFIKELDELKEVRRPESVAVKDPVIEKTTNPEEHGAAESAAEFTVDFTSSQRLPFTKPYSVAYFDDEVAVSNWTQVYIQTVAFLLEDYPDVLEGLINHNIYGQGRNDFADEDRAAQMVAPKKVADNFYLETNLSATDIVAKIRRILDICNVDYENLVIKYTKRDAVQPEPILQPAVPGQPIESKKETTTVGTPLVEREKFSAWMTNNGSASGTIVRLMHISLSVLFILPEEQNPIMKKDITLLTQLMTL